MRNRLRIFRLLLSLMVISSSQAQNTGPNAPEFDRFEPVEASDMVNLLTGDLSYNLPLLNVPNEGYAGHPIVLSYMAGIMVDQEASWVGLGWSLNQGSIKANRQGVPDEHSLNKKYYISTYEGKKTLNSINVSFGIGKGNGALEASIGHTWGSESYTTLGAGFRDYGAEVKIGSRGVKSVGLSYTHAIADAGGLTNGVNFSNGGVGFTSRIGSSGGGKLSKETNFNINSSIGISYRNNKLASIGNVSVGVSKQIGQQNASAGLSIVDKGMRFIIPLKGITLSYKKSKFEFKDLSIRREFIHGNLYPEYDTNDFGFNQSLYGLDIMSSPVSEYGFLNAWFNRRHNFLISPAKDVYQVSGQGIGGSFKVFHDNHGVLYGVNEGNHYTTPSNGEPARYLEGTTYMLPKKYFLDVDKRYNYNFTNESLFAQVNTGNNNFQSLSANDLTHLPNQSLSFINGSTSSSSYKNNTGAINSGEISKLGKRNIEWFTNEEIAFNRLIDGHTPKQRGFIESKNLNNDKRKALFGFEIGEDYSTIQWKNNQAKSIGAYSVTTEDGMVYNYALPVYNYEKVNYSKIINSSNNDISEQTTLETDKFATNWLLTSIIGPDYIDVNNNGIDEEDYGYWVEFNYGKFTDGYQWKFPYSQAGETVYNWTLNKPVVNRSFGRKDIFYLNSIKTKSHTAFFVKDKRSDSYGSSDNMSMSTTVPMAVYDPDNCPGGKEVCDVDNEFSLSVQNNIQHKTLRLSKIILLKNEDAHLIDASSGVPFLDYQPQDEIKYMEASSLTHNTFNVSNVNDNYQSESSIYIMDDIVDVMDLQANIADIKSKALRTIVLDHDYDLGNNCLNCDEGKLTLKKIDFYAQDEVSSTPPFLFNYYNGSINTNPTLLNYMNLKDGGNGPAELKKDIWGYYVGSETNHIPKEGSLRTITTPIGSEIHIDYEEDSYRNEFGVVGNVSYPVVAYYTGRNTYTDASSLCSESSYVYEKMIDPLIDEYYVELSKPLSSSFNIGDEITMLFHFEGLKTKKYIKLITEQCQDINNSWNSVTTIYNPDCNTNHCNDFNSNIQATLSEVSPNRRFVKVHLNTQTSDSDLIKILQGCVGLEDNRVMAFNQMYEIWNVKIKPNSNLGEIRGGGLRVKELSIKADGVLKNKTEYNYLENDNLTSGYTSYTPSSIEFVPYMEYLPTPNVMYKNVQVRAMNLESESDMVTNFEYNIPTHSEYIANNGYKIPGYFEVKNINDFNYIPPGHVPNIDQFYYSSIGNHQYSLSFRNTEIHNNLGKIGSISKVESKNSLRQSISKTAYEYYDMLENREFRVGIHQESYLTKRVNDEVHGNSLRNRMFNSAIEIIDYSLNIKKKSIHSNGISNTIFYQDYDVLLGTPQTVITENSFGDRHRAKTIYAHEVDEYSEMGPKSENINNKNMLTQEAGSYLYYDNGNTDYSDDPVLNASITTWKKDWNYREWSNDKYQTISTYPNTSGSHVPVWRKKTTYSWRSKINPSTGAYLKVDGTDNLFDEEDEFEFHNEASYENNHSGWVKNSEVTLYDHFSNPREVKDVNGQYASSKTWRGLTVSKIVGAAYSGYCASTAEEVVDGTNHSVGNVYFATETMQGGGASLNSNDDYTHTGNNSVKVIHGNTSAFISKFIIGQDKFDPNETYLLSVWIKHSGIGNIDGKIRVKLYANGSSTPVTISNPEVIQAGEWYQLRYTFNPANVLGSSIFLSNSEFKISIGSANYAGDLYFDDYRLYPIGASMTSYVYDDQDRIEYILDGNNLATKYEYDEKGRLKAIYSEKVGSDGGFVKSADSQYHMIRDNE